MFQENIKLVMMISEVMCYGLPTFPVNVVNSNKKSHRQEQGKGYDRVIKILKRTST